MELDHEFTVPVPVDQAWPVLLDVERIAPCMPGATLDSVGGDEFTGRLKVKLGAMTITYKGAARIASRDESSHTVSIEGTGKEARGAGTASATVQAQLHDEGTSTRVTVHTKLNITGRPAQFGRNILGEVGGKLIGRFADNLAAEITSPAGTAEAAGVAGTAETPGASGAAEAASATDTAGAAEAAGPVGAAEAHPQAAPAEEAPGAEAPGAEVPGAEVPGAEVPGAEVPGAEAPAEKATDAKPGGEKAAGDGASRAETTAAQPSGDGTPQAAEKTPEQTAPAATTPAAPRSSDDEAINLLEFAGPSIAKRVAPVVAGLAALWALQRIIRRKRR